MTEAPLAWPVASDASSAMVRSPLAQVVAKQLATRGATKTCVGGMLVQLLATGVQVAKSLSNPSRLLIQVSRLGTRFLLCFDFRKRSSRSLARGRASRG